MKKFFSLKVILFSFFFSTIILLAQPKEYSTINFIGRDSVKITADFYSVENKAAPTILLFHQFRASRGEYGDIAPVLISMGFNCFAFDTRAGGTDRWNNVENETTKNSVDVGRDYLSVYPDLESAFDYVKSKGFTGKIIVWGSSFSSVLVLKFAEEHASEIAGVLSFSPGEYIDGHNGIVAEWASKIKNLPTFIACGATESKRAKPIFEQVKSKAKVFYLPDIGRHGSSILLDDAKNWKPVKAFLKRFIK